MMIETIDTTMDHTHTASVQASDHRIRNSAAKVGRFILHFLEMTLAMMAGMPIFFMLRKVIPAFSSYTAAFKSGTILYDLAMAVFMAVPMVVWMIVRRHGWRHSLEMAVGMSAPVAAVAVIRLFGADAYLLWLSKASHLGMFLGMMIAMLYRRDHYTGTTGHSAHATHREIS